VEALVGGASRPYVTGETYADMLGAQEAFDPAKPPFSNSVTGPYGTNAFDGTKTYNASHQNYIRVDLPDLTPGAEYTLSFDAVRQSGGSREALYVCVSGASQYVNVGTADSTSWKMFSYTFRAGTGTYVVIRVNTTTTASTSGNPYVVATRRYRLEGSRVAHAYGYETTGSTVVFPS